VDEPLAMRRGGYVAYYQADGLGSVTSLSGSTGQPVATYVYDSFGNTTPTEGIFNPYRYTGREQDPETGLYYYRARYYDPTTGRFISEDPIRFKGGVDFYAYVRNNPISLADPLGLCPNKKQSDYCSVLDPNCKSHRFKKYVAFLGCENATFWRTVTDEEDDGKRTAFGVINALAIAAIRTRQANWGGVIAVGTAGAMDLGAMANANKVCTEAIYGSE
jgi:RHS repeat-associated protein